MAGESSGKDSEFTPRSLPLRELEPPGKGEAHLWFVDLQTLGSPMQQAPDIPHSGLTPRQQRTARRFWLRMLLGAYLGLPGKDVHVQRADRGKPMLDPSRHHVPLQFSMAASDGHCLAGFSQTGPIGVDLEPRQRQAGRPINLARRYFHPGEAEELEAMDSQFRDSAFLHTWACKEAVVKAMGHGIANQLCRFRVDVRPGQPAMLEIDDDEASAWQLAVCHPGPNHLGAVAARQADLALSCRTLVPVRNS